MHITTHKVNNYLTSSYKGQNYEQGNCSVAVTASTAAIEEPLMTCEYMLTHPRVLKQQTGFPKIVSFTSLASITADKAVFLTFNT